MEGSEQAGLVAEGTDRVSASRTDRSGGGGATHARCVRGGAQIAGAAQALCITYPAHFHSIFSTLALE